jgi:hypothetical protein
VKDECDLLNSIATAPPLKAMAGFAKEIKKSERASAVPPGCSLSGDDERLKNYNTNRINVVFPVAPDTATLEMAR